ncbi:hypothetical protein [Sediminibacterium soli]|uniref:hypothetical protein n=1 Tax=Sediminibacterium soli TaxID=2698829 RepID=UPI0013797B43|nr:hypothetical protein [Sediminibacterium soli]NCI45508.1 hypothetical protein [Sediminibacterium soli]
MSFEAFEQTLTANDPPRFSVYLTALWYDGKGDWEKAHDLINDLNGGTAAWVHAYLHRKEGDTGNARYWYHRAAKPFPDLSLQEEWQEIVKALP